MAIKELHQHESGVILHRNIELSNILIDDEGNFKLGDFGVVKVLGE